MARGFLNGPNVWVLIPLAALSIPIIAIIGSSAWFPWLFGSLVMVGAVTLATRSLLGYRHGLRMEEIAEQRKIADLEHQHLRSAERILELDDTQGLRRDLEPPETA